MIHTFFGSFNIAVIFELQKSVKKGPYLKCLLREHQRKVAKYLDYLATFFAHHVIIASSLALLGKRGTLVSLVLTHHALADLCTAYRGADQRAIAMFTGPMFTGPSALERVYRPSSKKLCKALLN